MNDIRILTVFDIHVSDQTPGYRADGYREHIFEKLWESVEIARREKATHVLWTGDAFDNKEARATSHATTQKMAAVLEAYGVPVYIVVGNHDLARGKNLESIPRQPLGILGYLPNVTLLTWDKVQLDEDVALYPIPGVEIIHEEDWVRHYITGATELRPIIVSHQLIARDIMQYPEQARHAFQPADVIAKVTDACLVISGDLHSRQGVYTRSDGRGGNVGFANLGATCRLSVSDVDHKPAVLLLTIAGDERRTLGFKEIPLTIRPADEVYRLEEHFEAKEHQADIDETIRRLTTTKLHKFSVDAVAEEIQKNDSVTSSVRDKAIELIEAVR